MTSRVASDKTHCKPFDLPIPEQWVFGYILRTYPKAIMLGNEELEPLEKLIFFLTRWASARLEKTKEFGLLRAIERLELLEQPVITLG